MLDLRAGYWQVDMAPDDRKFRAFTAGSLGFYEFVRMPMGLSNATAMFQRVTESVMKAVYLECSLCT